MAGDFKGLFIGVNQYKDKRIGRLDNVINDVKEIYNVIIESPSVFEQDNVALLSGNVATKALVETALNEFFTKAIEEDALVLYWAGHGGVHTGEGYFITYDTNRDSVVSSAVNMDYVRNLIDISKAHTIVAIFDCCHSGIVAREIDDFAVVLSRGLTFSGQGKVIITACTSAQYAYEHDKDPHGRFTYYFLKGLRGEAADTSGDIDISKLYSFVAERMEKHLDQVPVYNGRLQGRLILRKVDTRKLQTTEPYVPVTQLNEKVITNSGDWFLLEDEAIKFSSIHETNGRVVFEINNPNSHDVEVLNEVKQRDTFSRAAFSTITFGNTSEKIAQLELDVLHSVGDIKYRLSITLAPQDNWGLEMAYSIGMGVTISADEIAELRARRILLGEMKHTKFSLTEWRQIEIGVIGLDTHRVDRPLDFLYESMDDEAWKIARLKLISTLIHSKTIYSVTKLNLKIKQNKLFSVEFKGRRKPQYTGMAPFEIEIIEEVCSR